jgi:hypothetical protein
MKTIIFYVSKGARRAKLTAAHRAGSPLDIGAPPTKTVLANARDVPPGESWVFHDHRTNG